MTSSSAHGPSAKSRIIHSRACKSVGDEVEIVALRVDTRGLRPKPALRHDDAAGSGNASKARTGSRLGGVRRFAG